MFPEDDEAQQSGFRTTLIPLPKHCEFCGAASIQKCSSLCQRPKSYFIKHRPPFCPPGPRWNPKTDLENKKIDLHAYMKQQQIMEREEPSEPNDWIAKFFSA
jgi:hypothetical protein